MHVWTHLTKAQEGTTGIGLYPDGMVEHDAMVGEVLKQLDDLGIADNTIVVYSTDNGPNQFSWPDAATTPFRSEKNSNWEGAFRVPAMIRWPGKIKPGETSTEMFSGLDWFPTLLAAAGNPTVKEDLLKGTTIGTGEYAARWVALAWFVERLFVKKREITEYEHVYLHADDNKQGHLCLHGFRLA
jgi:arylsulfatase